jgi:hypothetical protein
MDKFTEAYIEAALWSSLDDKGNPLDENYDKDDIAPDTLQSMINDCKQFQDDNKDLLEQSYKCHRVRGYYDEYHAGHDFFLTRAHSGCGYWDRGLGKVGEKLSKKCGDWKEVDLYVGDDGKIYC